MNLNNICRLLFLTNISLIFTAMSGETNDQHIINGPRISDVHGNSYFSSLLRVFNSQAEIKEYIINSENGGAPPQLMKKFFIKLNDPNNRDPVDPTEMLERYFQNTFYSTFNEHNPPCENLFITPEVLNYERTISVSNFFTQYISYISMFESGRTGCSSKHSFFYIELNSLTSSDKFFRTMIKCDVDIYLTLLCSSSDNEDVEICVGQDFKVLGSVASSATVKIETLPMFLVMNVSYDRNEPLKILKSLKFGSQKYNLAAFILQTPDKKCVTYAECEDKWREYKGGDVNEHDNYDSINVGECDIIFFYKRDDCRSFLGDSPRVI